MSTVTGAMLYKLECKVSVIIRKEGMVCYGRKGERERRREREKKKIERGNDRERKRKMGVGVMHNSHKSE